MYIDPDEIIYFDEFLDERNAVVRDNRDNRARLGVRHPARPFALGVRQPRPAPRRPARPRAVDHRTGGGGYAPPPSYPPPAPGYDYPPPGYPPPPDYGYGYGPEVGYGYDVPPGYGYPDDAYGYDEYGLGGEPWTIC